jgi:hypothetical protein
VQIGRVALPPLPRRLAAPLSLQFGYVDLERTLGCAVELTRYPLGFSERFALRAGRADFCIPDGDSHFERPLARLQVRRACKATIVTADLDATVGEWIRITGVAPWHLFERPAARIAWALVDDMLIELVQPRAGAEFHHALLATRGQAVATIGFQPRTSFDELRDHCIAVGYRVAASEPLVAGARAAIFAARDSIGTDIEIVDGSVATLFARARPDRILQR